MNKNIIVGGLLVMLLLVGGAIAYQGDYTTKGPNFTEERHEQMLKAFENNDYSAWKELMSENGRHPRVLDVVTEENFPTFAAAHEAAENGDYEEAARLRSELGLGNGRGRHDGSGQGRHNGRGMRDGSGQNCFRR